MAKYHSLALGNSARENFIEMMGNKHLYWILVILWSIPLLFFIFSGFFFHVFVSQLPEDLDWFYYLYFSAAIVFSGNIIFLLLATFLYKTIFHALLIGFFSLGIVEFIIFTYFHVAVFKSDLDIVIVNALGMLFHLFIVNATMRNLNQARREKGLKQLSFI